MLFSITNYDFFNFPEKRSIHDYETGIKRAGEIHNRMRDILSIYRFGAMSAPGISDIDYFIVFRDGVCAKFFHPRNELSSEEKYLFPHYPSAVMSESIFRDNNLLSPIFHKELIYGKSLESEKRNITFEEAWVFLSDVIFMVYPEVFLSLFIKKNIDVRETLAMLHGIVYPIKLFEIIGVKKKKWENFIIDIKNLRSNWFNIQVSEQKEKVIFFLNAALLVCFEMIEEFDKQYKKNYVSQICESVSFISRKHVVYFISQYRGIENFKNMIEIYKKEGVVVSILPVSIAHQLIEYAMMKNRFGIYVKRFLSCKKRKITKNFLSDIRNQRAFAMSNFLDFSVRIGYRRGAFTPFHLGYLHHVCIINRLRDFLWFIFKKRKMHKIWYKFKKGYFSS